MLFPFSCFGLTSFDFGPTRDAFKLVVFIRPECLRLSLRDKRLRSRIPEPPSQKVFATVEKARPQFVQGLEEKGCSLLQAPLWIRKHAHTREEGWCQIDAPCTATRHGRFVLCLSCVFVCVPSPNHSRRPHARMVFRLIVTLLRSGTHTNQGTREKEILVKRSSTPKRNSHVYRGACVCVCVYPDIVTWECFPTAWESHPSIRMFIMLTCTFIW